MNICVYGASSDAIDKRYILAGELLGEEMAKRGHTLVFGGGAQGLMGAVARGMTKHNGKIIGIAPSFFNVDGILYDKCTEFHYPDTMRERKKMMEDMAAAFIMTPGGIGTYEEFFEILTLKQLGRHSKAIAVLNTMGYYNTMEKLMDETAVLNFMKPTVKNLYQCGDTPSEICDYLENYCPTDIDIHQTKFIK